MKMYILIKDSVPVGHAINCAAHAALACFMEHMSQRDMLLWAANSFKKVTCKVNDKEFKHALDAIEPCQRTMITESALDDRVVAAAFCPREEWPEIFKHFQLYK